MTARPGCDSGDSLPEPDTRRSPLVRLAAVGAGPSALLVQGAGGLQRAGLYLYGPEKIELEAEGRRSPLR